MFDLRTCLNYPFPFPSCLWGWLALQISKIFTWILATLPSNCKGCIIFGQNWQRTSLVILKIPNDLFEKHSIISNLSTFYGFETLIWNSRLSNGSIFFYYTWNGTEQGVSSFAVYSYRDWPCKQAFYFFYNINNDNCTFV